MEIKKSKKVENFDQSIKDFHSAKLKAIGEVIENSKSSMVALASNYPALKTQAYDIYKQIDELYEKIL